MIHSNLFFGFVMYLEKIVIINAYCDIMLRIRSKTGGKLVCRRDCLLNSLVVRRFASRDKRMIRSVVAGSEATGYNQLVDSFRITFSK